MFPDVKLKYDYLLTDDEKALSKELCTTGTMNVSQSYQWLLLAEISQLRAMADNLHAHLVALVNAETAHKIITHIGQSQCAHELGVKVCKKCGAELEQ